MFVLKHTYFQVTPPQKKNSPGCYIWALDMAPQGGVIFGRAPSAPMYFLLKTGGVSYLVARNGPPGGDIYWGGVN